MDSIIQHLRNTNAVTSISAALAALGVALFAAAAAVHGLQAARAWLAAGPARRRLRAFHRVAAVSTGRQVMTRQGGYQPDGRVYPDSDSLSATADLSVPAGMPADLLPLDLVWEFRRPDGTVLSSSRASAPAAPGGRARVQFNLTDAGPLLAHPGAWRLNLLLAGRDGAANRPLATWQMEVVDHAALLADLAAADVRLVVLPGGGGRPYVGALALTTAEAVAPQVVLRPRTFHPGKYVEGVDVTIDLVQADTGRVTSRATAGLPFRGGAARLSNLSVPVAGTDVAAGGGRWEVRLSVAGAAGGREVARLPFGVITADHAAGLIRVDRFDVDAIDATGRRAAAGADVCRAGLAALSPVLRLSTPVPFGGGARYAASVAAVVDGRPLGEVRGDVVFAGPAGAGLDFAPGRLPLEQLGERTRGRKRAATVTFLFLVGGRCLGRRDVVLRPPPTRFADVQGRLVPGADDGTDYDAEAARLLAAARVR